MIGMTRHTRSRATRPSHLIKKLPNTFYCCDEELCRDGARVIEYELYTQSLCAVTGCSSSASASFLGNFLYS